MSSAWAFEWALKALMITGLSLVPLRILRRASASHRRLVLLLGAVMALLAPFASLLPRYEVTALPVASRAGQIVAEALATAPSVRLAQPTRTAVNAPATTGWPWDRALLALWTLGSAIVAVRFVAGSVRAGRLAGRARVCEGGLLESAEVNSPVVIGLLRPRVVLPVGARSWSAARREAVLLHERAHINSFDGLALAAAQCCVVLYWFQPFSWLLLRELRRECEAAADERALASGIRASDYAEHLLAVARDVHLRGAIAMASGGSELARRIRRLLGRERLPRPPVLRDVLLTSFVALGVAAAVACAGAGQPPAASAAELGARPRDQRLQAIADAEARNLRQQWAAQRAVVVVLDAKSSRVLALYDDRPEEPITPASTLKPFVVAAALDQHRIRVDERFDCGNGTRDYGGEVLRDAGSYASLDAREILAVSSNIGLSRVFDALGGDGFQRGLSRFGLTAPRVDANTLSGAVTALGQRQISVRPVTLAAAYAAFANDGLYRAPSTGSTPAEPQRAVDSTTARTLLSMLESAVSDERATGRQAQLDGVRVAGKTGTSDEAELTYASFAGIVPANAPRYVIYVGVRHGKPAAGGGQVAAPAFARIAAQALQQ